MVEHRKVARTGLNIAAFGDDAMGELYLCAFDGFIYRFRQKLGDLAAISRAFPHKLSQTGLYLNTATEATHPAMIPYDVNVPLWSDQAAKRRYLVLPRAASLQFNKQHAWQFPIGAILVKNFYLPVSLAGSDLKAENRPTATPTPLRRLETRLLVHASEGWQGYTYVWNEAQTDAELLTGSKQVEYLVDDGNTVRSQEWIYPSRSDCMACHTKSAQFALGLTTRQLNRPSAVDPRINQLEHFQRIGVFSKRLPMPVKALEAYPDWNGLSQNGLGDATVDALARAYLDANCAMCHAEDGIVRVPDLRYHTPLEKMQLVGRQAGQEN